MFARKLISVVSGAALLGFVLGCGAPSKPAAGGGTGSTKSSDPELNKSMTPEEIAALRPLEQNAKTQEDTEVAMVVGALAGDPRMSDSAKRGIRGKRMIFIGTVLEKSPDGGELPILVLDGGNIHGKQYTAKCSFAVSEGESLQEIKPQDTVRVEGVTDAELKELIVEIKECVLKPANKSTDRGAPGAEAEKTADEKLPATKP